MSAVKLVIFDWDGTVMDSVGRIVSSMRAAAALSALEVPSHDAVKQIIGLIRNSIISLPASVIVDKDVLHYRHQPGSEISTRAKFFFIAERSVCGFLKQIVRFFIIFGQ